MRTELVCRCCGLRIIPTHEAPKLQPHVFHADPEIQFARRTSAEFWELIERCQNVGRGRCRSNRPAPITSDTRRGEPPFAPSLPDGEQES